MALLNFLSICKKYLTENYQNFIVTIIGLIFVVSIFTFTLGSDHSVRIEYIKEELGEEDLEISFVTQYTDRSYSQINVQQQFDEAKSYINKQIEDKKLSRFLNHKLSSISLSVHQQNKTTQELSPIEFQLGYLSRKLDTIFESLSKFKGSFPTHEDEVIFIRGYGLNEAWYAENLNVSTVKVGQTVTLVRTGEVYSEQTDQYISQDFRKNVTVVGIYDTKTNLKISSDKDGLDVVSTEITDNFILENPAIIPGTFYTYNTEQFISLVESLRGDEATQYYMLAEYAIDLASSLDPNQFGETASSLNTFFRDTSLNLKYSLMRYKKPEFDSIGYRLTSFTRITEIDNIQIQLASTLYLNFLLAIPSMAITLFFTSFTNNMFFDRRKQQIRLLKTRGIKRTYLMGILALETLIATSLALLVGYTCGSILTATTVRSKSFLQFELAINAIEFSIPTFSAVFLWTLVFSGWLWFTRINQLNNLDVSNSEKFEENEPFWRRIYLDIVLVLLGVIGNLFFVTMFLRTDVVTDLVPITGVVRILVLFFFPFSFFLLFGGLLILTRVIPPLIHKVGHFAWNRLGNLFSYSLTNLIRQKESVIRTILLVSMIFSLMWAMFSIPPVIQNHDYREIHYQVGANCYYAQWWNNTLGATFENDPNILDYTPVGNYVYRGGSQFNIRLLVIFDKFLDVAYYENNFGSLEHIKELLNTRDNHSGLIQSNNMEIFGKNIGENVTFSFSDFEDHNVTIRGEYTYYPNFILEEVKSDRNITLNMVVTNRTIEALLEKKHIIHLSDVEQGYYLKLAPDANITNLKYIYGENNLQIAKELLDDKYNSLVYRILWMQLNILFLVILITIFLTIIIYGYKQSKGRARELSVERSLGLKIRQLIRLFIFESCGIIGFSTIIGSLMGAVFSYSITSVLLLVLMRSALPKPIFFYPVKTISIVMVMVLLISFVSSTIPAWIAKRQDLVKSLKVK